LRRRLERQQALLTRSIIISICPASKSCIAKLTPR
jgi:hypothetical protein